VRGRGSCRAPANRPGAGPGCARTGPWQLGQRLGLSLLYPDRLGLAGADLGRKVGQGLVRLSATPYEALVDLTARGRVVDSKPPTSTSEPLPWRRRAGSPVLVVVLVASSRA
jgi:hypothetical protein